MQQNRTTLGLLLLVLITGSIKLRAQSLQLHVDPHPSPYFSDWQQHRQTAFITLGNTGSSTISYKIGTQLYDGSDNLIAETDISKMPVMQLNPGAPVQYFFEDIYPVSAVKYNGNYDVMATVQSGKIKDDNYRLSVQMLDAQTGVALVAPQCRYFSIVAFQQPTLISPRQGETIARNGVRRPMLRWTPVQPSYPGIVTYRLQVMEVLPGQEPGQAFRTNRPILEKDFKRVTQTVWPLEFQLPDADMSYVWSVQALDEQERPIGENEGRAEYYSFNIRRDVDPKGRPSIALLTPANNSTTDAPSFKWTPVQPSRPGDGVTYRLRIVELKGDQSPEQAYRTNKPILDKDYKNSSNVTLPGTPGFDTGKAYVWRVQALDDEGKGIGENEGRSEYASFRLNKPMMERYDRRIMLTSPADNGTTDAPSFSWTPIQPPIPGAIVTYRLTVIRVADGEEPADAMLKRPIGRPIIIHDYKSASASWPDDGLQPDSGAAYIWNVQALDDAGKGIGENEGRSEYASFRLNKPMMERYDRRIMLTSPADNGTTDAPSFSWTPIQPSMPGAIVTYRLTVIRVADGEEPADAKLKRPIGRPIIIRDYKNAGASWPGDGPQPDSGAAYIWNVQALDDAGKGIGENEGRSEYASFRLNKPMMERYDRRIMLTSPADNGTTDAPSFKWTPVQPSRPGDGVTYRLRIVELKGDQSQEEAYRTNKPILEKDYKNSSNVTLPGTPLFDRGKTYVWRVQALDGAGKGIGENEGRSEYASFSFRRDVDPKGRPSIALLTPANNGTTDAPSFKWTPVQPSRPGDGVTYRLRIVELKGDQSPEEAYHRNKPMFEKDYKNRSSVTLPGKTGFDTAKTYVWYVQALDDEGKGIGENEGRSEYATFKVTDTLPGK